jgi:hypothetical protein
MVDARGSPKDVESGRGKGISHWYDAPFEPLSSLIID